MTINTAWQVKIGLFDSQTDFTSRVLSMNIDQSVDVNVVGRGLCSITLLNKDGALTPGGGGTYSSNDWFAQGVFVSSVTNIGAGNTTTAVFHGIVVDFDLVDDGVFSTVTITAQDGLTIAGRTNNVLLPLAVGNYTEFVNSSFNAIGVDPIIYPKLGKTTAVAIYTNLSGFDKACINDNTFNHSTYADLIQGTIVPSANDVLWTNIIDTQAGSLRYQVCSAPYSITRTDANATTFEFVPSGSVASTKLPFSNNNFSQEFNNDELITQANVKGLYAGATINTATSSNIATYGSRAVSFTSTLIKDNASSVEMATNLVNRYSNISFTPASLELTASMVKANCADAAHSQWYNLLSIVNGLWQKVLITWTGSGAVAQTAECVVSGRSINVTPDETVVLVRLKSGADNQSFILDNNNFGVLNQNRLA